MKFCIQKNRPGNLAFSVPVQDAMEKAEDEVAALCRDQYRKAFSERKEPYAQLEMELKWMKETGTAFHFLILREAAKFSREKGYPLMANSQWACSLIAYLLEISQADPFYLFRSGRFTLGKPYFEIHVAPPVFNQLVRRLQKRFGEVDADELSYYTITVMESERCEILGKLAEKAGESPSCFGNDVYISVLHTIAEQILSKSLETKNDNEEEHFQSVRFAYEIKNIAECDFDTLVSIFAYDKGTFSKPKCLENLKSPNFFVLREELVEALLACGMPYEDAEYLAHKGVWHNTGNDERREEDARLMERYHVPREIRDSFSCIWNLQPAYGCINRLIFMCMGAWYKIHWPKEYGKICREESLQ